MKKLLICLSVFSALALAEPAKSDSSSDQPKVIMVKPAAGSNNQAKPLNGQPSTAAPKKSAATKTSKTKHRKKTTKKKHSKKHTSKKQTTAKKAKPATGN